MSDEVERIRDEHARERRLPSSYTADIGLLLARVDELEREQAILLAGSRIERLRAVARAAAKRRATDPGTNERQVACEGVGIALDALHEGDLPDE